LSGRGHVAVGGEREGRRSRGSSEKR